MDPNTLYEKLAAVPMPIKQWLGSESTIANIEKLEGQLNLPIGSSNIIAKTLQKLQIKDLGPEYFSGSLALELKLERDKAKLIVNEIKKTILKPIEKPLTDYGIDLSLLEKFEMPIAKPASVSPTIIQEMKPAATIPTSTPTPAPLPQIALQPTFPEKGWSTVTTTNAAPKPKIAGEFERLAAMKSGGIAPTPIDAKPKPMPASIMMGNASAPKTIQNAPDFHPSISTQNIMPGGKAIDQLPVKPAVLEIGNIAPRLGSMGMNPQIPTPQPMKSDLPKVVHYGDLKSSLPAQLPIMNKNLSPESGRKISEITDSSMPKPISQNGGDQPSTQNSSITTTPIPPKPAMLTPMGIGKPSVPGPSVPPIPPKASNAIPTPPKTTNAFVPPPANLPIIPPTTPAPKSFDVKPIVKDFLGGK